MVLKSIYLLRHAARQRYCDVPSSQGQSSNEGASVDDSLSEIGIQQSKELADYLIGLDAELDTIYTSGSYRCLLTVLPFIRSKEEWQKELSIRYEPGFGEWNRPDRDYPRSPTPEQIKYLIPNLDLSYEPIHISKQYEDFDDFNDRSAFVLASLINRLDKEHNGPESILVCTHGMNVRVLLRLLRCITDSLNRFDMTTPFIGLYKVVRNKGYPLQIEAEKDQKMGFPKLKRSIDFNFGGNWAMEVKANCGFLSSGNIGVAFKHSFPPSRPRNSPYPFPYKRNTFPNFFDNQKIALKDKAEQDTSEKTNLLGRHCMG